MADRAFSVTYASVDAVETALREKRYIAERGLATAIYLALKLGRPLFLEGEAGVGKTEVAKVIADILDTRLIRLQCYEGLDASHAVYEWNYSRQILYLRLLDARGERPSEQDVFAEEFLLKRPLLQALEAAERAPVLLIDELDRSDEEFEAYLLEILSDFQITIPELGTIRAEHRPIVVLTSNRTREVHDALKRRCLYYWIDFPSFAKEMEIIAVRAPNASRRLAQQVTAFIQSLRHDDLYKRPGIAETLDWLSALEALGRTELSPTVVDETLGVILKYRDDIGSVSGTRARQILEDIENRSTG